MEEQNKEAKSKISLYDIACQKAKEKGLSGDAANDYVIGYQCSHCSNCHGEKNSGGDCANYC